MRTGIAVDVTPGDGERLLAFAADGNSPQKQVWRARIVLLTAQGCGTAEIMRRARVGQTAVWRRQERFMQEDVDGLLRDKTPHSLAPEIAARVVTLTMGPPSGETTHRAAPAIARRVGIASTRCSASCESDYPARCRQLGTRIPVRARHTRP